MEFLALMTHATGDARYRAAFERGVDYLLAAQYPNGGWPQFFPLREGYYSRITFNDNAMVRVLTLLRDLAAGKPPYAFVDAGRRKKADAAVARGIQVILRTQVKQGGRLTAWCAQHDERTLEPAWARNYEPPTLSGSESVGIVRFLMDIDRPTPEIVAAVDAAVGLVEGRRDRGPAARGVHRHRRHARPARRRRSRPRHRCGRASTSSARTGPSSPAATKSCATSSARSSRSAAAATPTTAPGPPRCSPRTTRAGERA